MRDLPSTPHRRRSSDDASSATATFLPPSNSRATASTASHAATAPARIASSSKLSASSGRWPSTAAASSGEYSRQPSARSTAGMTGSAETVSSPRSAKSKRASRAEKCSRSEATRSCTFLSKCTWTGAAVWAQRPLLPAPPGPPPSPPASCTGVDRSVDAPGGTTAESAKTGSRLTRASMRREADGRAVCDASPLKCASTNAPMLECCASSSARPESLRALVTSWFSSARAVVGASSPAACSGSPKWRSVSDPRHDTMRSAFHGASRAADWTPSAITTNAEPQSPCLYWPRRMAASSDL
mmetsp:Transcript_19161/g.49475  ORF Transcript_19161/g.49475 Transcript_19161/m.49475 type:complete len:299 (-) Transcript_19161:533-1429(-)